jgi:hypothetical protein
MLLANVRGGINSLMAEVLEDHIRLHMLTNEKNTMPSAELAEDLIGLVRACKFASHIRGIQKNGILVNTDNRGGSPECWENRSAALSSPHHLFRGSRYIKRGTLSRYPAKCFM